MTFHEQAAADTLFRQDMGRWFKTLRAMPVKLTVDAGALSWTSRSGARLENGVDCLFATNNVTFGPPDVSNLDYTKAVVEGLQAGESTILYLLSRRSPEELARQLIIDVGGVKAQVSCA